jgi:hemin uptake protein HemP
MTDRDRHLRIVHPSRDNTGCLRQPLYISSAELFAGEDEIVILHRGQQYRLRITRENKLILTK